MNILQLMSAVKTGTVAHSRFALATTLTSKKIPTERSGGGL